MRKTISVILILCFTAYMFGCSSSRFVDLEDPPAGESVRINLIDGTAKEGVILKKSDKILKYVDTETSKPEDLDISRINTIEKLSTVYDLTAKPISESDISHVKGSGKTWGYGIGGFLAGGLIGFGAGALFSAAADQEVALIYPILGFGAAGAIFLGMKGSEVDRNEAIDEIRKQRYEITQKKLNEEIKEQEEELQKEKQDLEKMKEKNKSGSE